MNLNNLTIGSIIHGTLIPKDLAAVYLHTADRLDIDVPTAVRADAETLARITLPSDELAAVLNDLDDLIAEELPPYIVFGAHEGDGTDIGFWWADWVDEELGEALLAADRAATGDSNDTEIDALRDANHLLMDRLHNLS